MTDTNFSFTPENLFEEIVARGREQGVSDQAAYDDMVEEVIEAHRGVGEIHTDDETEDWEEQLRGRFEEYVSLLGEAQL
ncbi:hypothetical protein HY631_02105 [Candidatus Uhrbacteria bacterium]|nr:hypothetical protein [Candidatus Uhrbacteria bacterium]